jgi:hydrogenase expression/formation protein HypC
MCLGIPGKIVTILDDDPFSRMAELNFSGVKKVISLTFVPEAREGNYVIVHAGFAIGILDEKEAAETIGYLQQIVAAQEGEHLE